MEIESETQSEKCFLILKLNILPQKCLLLASLWINSGIRQEPFLLLSKTWN